MIDYDAELQLHNEQFRAALAIRAANRVLAIGCGTGQTTREAALVASDGDALGVDIDEGMIARARELADRERVPNVRFEVGDAQTHPFQPGACDVAISRFGTMFFTDPTMAFRNIARAVRAGGRLVMMVRLARDRNEWAVAIDQALGAGEHGVAAAPGPDPFLLAEPPTVRRILAAAGFADCEFRDVNVPVYYGQDVDAALAFVGRFANVSEAVSRSGPSGAGTILARRRATLESRASERGVWFGSRAWSSSAHGVSNSMASRCCPLEDFLSELLGQPRQRCEVFMPFKSQAQRRKFAQLLVEGKISNETFEEWNRETGAKRLPERARRKTKPAKKSTGKKSPLKRTRSRSATRAHKR